MFENPILPIPFPRELKCAWIELSEMKICEDMNRWDILKVWKSADTVKLWTRVNTSRDLVLNAGLVRFDFFVVILLEKALSRETEHGTSTVVCGFQ